jgi:hypothetical protein
MNIARHTVRLAIQKALTEAETDRTIVSIFGNNDSIPLDDLLRTLGRDRLTILKHEDGRLSRDESERRF